MSGVNFLSFGKREKLLRRTHKKYLIYIFMCLLISGLLFRNIFLNSVEYGNLNSIQTYKNINDYDEDKQKYLDKIYFLMNDMRLFIEKIAYGNDALNIEVRILDKKDIYGIVDNLKKNNFNVISYVCTSEENGIFMYAIEVGV